jgi:hypothetical protein
MMDRLRFLLSSLAGVLAAPLVASDLRPQARVCRSHARARRKDKREKGSARRLSNGTECRSKHAARAAVGRPLVAIEHAG